MNLRVVYRSLVVAIVFAAYSVPALAAENYQTDIAPTPKSGREGPTILGHGMVTATLESNRFSVHGTFSGLASPATEGRLCVGLVMGATGPSIAEIKVSQAPSGDIAGTFTLTPDQVTALKVGRLYVILYSQSAPKGNLWGWFQPAHVTVGQDVPQMGRWYIPNFLNEKGNGTANKTGS